MIDAASTEFAPNAQLLAAALERLTALTTPTNPIELDPKNPWKPATYDDAGLGAAGFTDAGMARYVMGVLQLGLHSLAGDVAGLESPSIVGVAQAFARRVVTGAVR